jgi:hypothetical protein
VHIYIIFAADLYLKAQGFAAHLCLTHCAAHFRNCGQSHSGLFSFLSLSPQLRILPTTHLNGSISPAC